MALLAPFNTPLREIDMTFFLIQNRLGLVGTLPISKNAKSAIPHSVLYLAPFD